MFWINFLVAAAESSPLASPAPAAAGGNEWVVLATAIVGGGAAALLTSLGNYRKDSAIARASEIAARQEAEKTEVETEQARAELAAAAFGAVSKEVESWVARVISAKDAQIATLEQQLAMCQERLDRCRNCPDPTDSTGATNRGQHPWPPGWRPPG